MKNLAFGAKVNKVKVDHNRKDLETNLKDLGQTILDQLLKKILLPSYYESVLFTKIKIFIFQGSGFAVTNEWVFLLPKDIRGQLNGIAPFEKHAVFEIQVFEENILNKNTNKITAKSVQSIYRYFLGMGEYEAFLKPNEINLQNQSSVEKPMPENVAEFIETTPATTDNSNLPAKAADFLKTTTPEVVSGKKIKTLDKSKNNPEKKALDKLDKINLIEKLFISGVSINSDCQWDSLILKGKEFKPVEAIYCSFRGLRILKRKIRSSKK